MSVAISWANKMQLAKCDIMVGFPISSHKCSKCRRSWLESVHGENDVTSHEADFNLMLGCFTWMHLRSYHNSTIQSTYWHHEQEKKREYGDRVREVEATAAVLANNSPRVHTWNHHGLYIACNFNHYTAILTLRLIIFNSWLTDSHIHVHLATCVT